MGIILPLQKSCFKCLILLFVSLWIESLTWAQPLDLHLTQKSEMCSFNNDSGSFQITRLQQASDATGDRDAIFTIADIGSADALVITGQYFSLAPGSTGIIFAGAPLVLTTQDTLHCYWDCNTNHSGRLGGVTAPPDGTEQFEETFAATGNYESAMSAKNTGGWPNPQLVFNGNFKRYVFVQHVDANLSSRLGLVEGQPIKLSCEVTFTYDTPQTITPYSTVLSPIPAGLLKNSN